ncbi:hypothetical protein FRC04_005281 [Tulasnella sp. 424]|nr:hypothetical protein FRC04_005281 [Tulasnella sp. 424]
MDEETLQGITVELEALTLQNVSEIQSSLTEDGEVPSGLLVGFRSEDPEIRKTAVIKIRKILQNFPPSQVVQPVVDTGLVSDFVSLLDSDDAQLQCEAAWIVTNIASGTTQQTQKVIDAGAIPKLARLAASPNEDVSDNAVWALANIAGDSAVLRDRVEDEGGINALVTILDNAGSNPTKVQRRTVWAISCYLNPWSSRKLPVTKVKHLLPCLVRYIQETPVDEANMESLEYAVQSLDRISDRHLSRLDFIATGVVSRLVQLLADSSSSITLQKQALRCLGYLVSGNDLDTDSAVEAGLLPALSVPLASENQHLCQLACWNASNIAAGNHRQVLALLDSGLLEPVLRILGDTLNNNICRREACWVISNLTRKVDGGGVGQTLIEGHCLEGLTAALLIPDRQSRELAVLGITNILEWKGSLESETDSSLLVLLRSSSCPQNLRVVRDSREIRDLRLKKDCHNLLARYFPEHSRRARV